MASIIKVYQDIIYNYQHSKHVNNPYDEIKFIANNWHSMYGCESTNKLLNDILEDRRGARSLLIPNNRYAVPVYNVHNLVTDGQDDYIRRSELNNIMKQYEFKSFINSVKCNNIH